MKERTLSQRNLLGAFVGGVLGILAFGYFDNTFLMMIGCFIGVIGGWWYEEIGQHIADTFNEGVAKTQRAATFLFTPVYALRAWRVDLKRQMDDLGAFYIAALAAIPIVWLLRRPVVFVLWMREHLVNRAKFVRVIAAPVFWTLNALWFIPVGVWVMNEAGRLNHVPGGFFPVLGCIAMFIAMFMAGICFIMIPFVAHGSGDELPLAKMRLFYDDWSCYASKGPIGFFVSEVAFLFKAWFSTTIWAFAAVAWFLGAGAVFLAIVGVISGAIGLVKGVYQVSFRAGHWLCFGMTLITTAISATIFHSYFGDARILWIVALLTGVVTAVATEVARRISVRIFTTHRPARAVALIPLGWQLRPSGSLFWRVSVQCGDWFIGLLPMHPQHD